uniref:Valine--tRNA ligase, mitochondrial n=1 Tax=Tetraodon nigroviridis TaxID=99883 RepID=H3CK65_TETNG
RPHPPVLSLAPPLKWVSSHRCFRGKAAKPSSSSSQSDPQRPKAEKQRRRREREEAVLTRQRNTSEDAVLKWSQKQKIAYSAHSSAGAKKDTSLPFPPSYSPEYVEPRWYEWWEKEGFFTPEQHDRSAHAVDQTFCLCIPPPNVTGTLHVGHALTVAVEDALVRWRRMQGQRVLWVPGCDHAGIATQTVVERKLRRETGKRRQDFSRQEFLQEVWKWKEEKGEQIYQQLRSLGASLDWSRACFTLDPGFSGAVTEAFVRLCDAGLIYRAESLVNWSCALESAISDIEVDSRELPGPTLISVPGYETQVEFGRMFTFAYPLEGCAWSDGEVAVSTTRPETMLGDVAVAVHPDDPRYQAVHGKLCRHPFTHRLLPIITDTLVDMQLGTGAVKVTPAHDHTDFLLSQRHSLPRLTVIGGDGTMTAACGPWLQAVKRFQARQLVVEALVEKKLFRGHRGHSMSLPVCSRSGDVVEPLLRKQWFVRCQQMAQRAVQAVEEQQLRISPPFHTKTWRRWLSGASDWCISRQLWWGHRIPAYRVKLPDWSEEQEELWVCGRSQEEARRRAADRCGVRPDAVTLTQDPDVLDTWFSSALFPFAMLGWPEQSADLQRFYPNSLLETGSDLIFFWVARMVMLGTQLTGQLPFRQVLLHPLVRDQHGRKMSKSLGNVIDPLDVIHGASLEVLQQKVKEGNVDPREQLVAMEAVRKDFPAGIPACGADALRLSLCSHRLQGEDIRLSISQVLACRTFCNKMWQTLRFTLRVLAEGPTPLRTLEETAPVSSMDQWICSRLYSTLLQCEQAFPAWDLHLVTAGLQAFWVHSLCDVYLEYIKPLLAHQRCSSGQMLRSVLFHCVSTSLALLSPFMPFITEELWQRLRPFQPGAATQTSLCLQPYPSTSQLAHWHFPAVEQDFELVQDLVRVARSLRAQCGMTQERPAAWAVCSPGQAQVLHRFGPAVRTLGRISSLHVCCPDGAGAPAAPPPAGSLVGVVDHTCRVHLAAQAGASPEARTQQLSLRRDKLLPKLQKVLLTVQCPDYRSKAPAHAREKMEAKMLRLQQELRSLEEQMKSLKEPPGALGGEL